MSGLLTALGYVGIGLLGLAGFATIIVVGIIIINMFT